MIDEIELPENTAVEVAGKTNAYLEQIEKGQLYLPIDDELGTSKGLLTLTFPAGIDIGVEVIIPLENNLKDQNISLKDGMALMNAVNIKLSMVGTNQGIREKFGRGPSIIMTGTKHIYVDKKR